MKAFFHLKDWILLKIFPEVTNLKSLMDIIYLIPFEKTQAETKKGKANSF